MQERLTHVHCNLHWRMLGEPPPLPVRWNQIGSGEGSPLPLRWAKIGAERGGSCRTVPCELTLSKLRWDRFGSSVRVMTHEPRDVHVATPDHVRGSKMLRKTPRPAFPSLGLTSADSCCPVPLVLVLCDRRHVQFDDFPRKPSPSNDPPKR